MFDFSGSSRHSIVSSLLETFVKSQNLAQTAQTEGREFDPADPLMPCQVDKAAGRYPVDGVGGQVAIA